MARRRNTHSETNTQVLHGRKAQELSKQKRERELILVPKNMLQSTYGFFFLKITYFPRFFKSPQIVAKYTNEKMSTTSSIREMQIEAVHIEYRESVLQ